jgi:tRNA (guanine-N7-)-methyltransferase
VLRLYGRRVGHPLRPRQERLIAETLPRLRVDPAQPLAGLEAFPRVGLEVGFGSGEHALALLEAEPDLALIACEVYLNGIASLLSRLVPEGLEASAPLPPRLRLHDGDARPLLEALPESSLDLLILLFPDPWPKARHTKRRFVHPDLLPRIARVLKKGGEWRVATDDPTHQAWVAEVMGHQPYFDAPPPSSERPPGWPATRYEEKALREGRRPLYWRFRRR